MARSFFSRLFGGGDQYDDYFDEEGVQHLELETQSDGSRHHAMRINRPGSVSQQNSAEPELAVDLYQTSDEIVVKALVAGVVGQNLDITLTREMIAITGSRQEEKEVNEEDYFQRELYWGSFSRTIMLPEEVDVDMAEAVESHGILTIRLPKINKRRETKLKVRSR